MKVADEIGQIKGSNVAVFKTPVGMKFWKNDFGWRKKEAF
jgi:hypothetical protein